MSQRGDLPAICDSLVEKHFNPNDEVETDSEEVCFVGWRYSKMSILYWFFVVCTFGLFWLLSRWIPKLYVKMNYYEAPLDIASFICPKGKYGELVKVFGELSDDLRDMGTHKYFEWRHEVWRWYDGNDDLPGMSHFRPVRYPFHKPISEIFLHYPEGRVDIPQRVLRKLVFGDNLIHVDIPGVIQLLLDEVLHPFYLFQVFSVLLWFYEVYITYSIAIILISAIGAIVSVVQTRSNLKNLKSLAEFECEVVRVFNGEQIQMTSRHLLPGDLIEIKEGLILPCDVVLLSGQCVANEAMLTGESIPVIKTPVVHDDEDIFDPKSSKHSKHTLYGGTQIIQTKAQHYPLVVGMVFQTGYSTTKGGLVRSIMFPKPLNFKFYKDSFYFIIFLFVLSSSAFFLMSFRLANEGDGLNDIIVRGLDLYTVAIPPALPIALTIGVVFAVDRLKKERIACVAPSRVNLAGLVSIICFDKTGTLTEEGLDVMAVRESIQNHPDDQAIFQKEEPEIFLSSKELLNVLVACHGLALLKGELVGDSLEVKMFLATNWTLFEPDVGSEYLKDGILSIVSKGELDQNPQRRIAILKRFDFNSEIQRMSTVCKDMDTNEVFVCSKGAPEVLGKIVNHLSLPEDFDPVLTYYTRCGFRVLACGYRSLGVMDSVEARRMSRDEAEQDMNFAGLLVMQNKLKPETTPTLSDLNQAKINSIMVTGDNPLTACHVAATCKLVQSDDNIFLSEVTQNKAVMWKSINHPEKGSFELHQVLGNSMKVLQKPINDDHIEIQFEENRSEIFAQPELAVTGPAFEILIKNEIEFRTVLQKSQIYARMKPSQKQHLVESLIELDNTVAMCGDGANDCGALKAADVGVSLSEADASIAAPFTSKTPNISCMTTLLREGRCALVTSFQAFKYMAAYSFIQFTSCLVLDVVDGILGDMQFLWVDLFTVMPLAFVSEYTGAYHELSKTKPVDRLMSFDVIVSLLLQTFLNVSFQILVFSLLYTPLCDSWFTPLLQSPHDAQDSSKNTQFAEVSAVFLLSNFQYIASVFAFSVGKPYRKAFFTNCYFSHQLIISQLLTTFQQTDAYSITLIVLLIVNSFLVITENEFITNLFELVNLHEYRFLVLLLSYANVISVIVVEHLHQAFLVPAYKKYFKKKKKSN